MEKKVYVVVKTNWNTRTQKQETQFLDGFGSPDDAQRHIDEEIEKSVKEKVAQWEEEYKKRIEKDVIDHKKNLQGFYRVQEVNVQ